MEVYLQVRRAHFDEGRSKRSIARDFGLARGTVDKMCAFAVPPGYRREQDVRRPKLDGFTDTIDAWLLKDLEVPKKQRHTAKRIYKPALRGGRVHRRVHDGEGLCAVPASKGAGDVYPAGASARAWPGGLWRGRCCSGGCSAEGSLLCV